MSKKANILVTLLISCAVVTITILFRVKTVRCSVDTKPCPAELEAQLQPVHGTSLFFSHHEEIIATSLRNEPYSLKHLEKTLPTTLHIVLSQETPRYYLQTTDNQSFLIYESGHSQQATPTAEYPLITIYHQSADIVTDATLAHSVHSVVSELITSLYKYNLSVQNSNWPESSYLKLELTNGKTVLVQPENVTQQLHTLATVLAAPEFHEVATNITEIDLRFELPVLRTGQ